MPRKQLLRGMQQLGLPGKIIDLVLQLHQQAKYHIGHDASQGVGQGCAVAPVLWLIYSHLISTELAGLIGHEAACELLSIFADDYHCSTLSNTHRTSLKVS